MHQLKLVSILQIHYFPNANPKNTKTFEFTKHRIAFAKGSSVAGNEGQADRSDDEGRGDPEPEMAKEREVVAEELGTSRLFAHYQVCCRAQQ